MSIKFEVGKKYVNKRGDVVGLVRFITECKVLKFELFTKEGKPSGNFYTTDANGVCHDIIGHHPDTTIIAEYEPKENSYNSISESIEKKGGIKPHPKSVKPKFVGIGMRKKMQEEKQESPATPLPERPDRKTKDNIWKIESPSLTNLPQENEANPIGVFFTRAEEKRKRIEEQKTNDKYNRTIKDRTGKELGVVDVYCVGDAFGVTSIPLNHALKKILCAGTRGKGDEVQDLEEAIQAIQRRLMEVKK